MRLVLFRPFDFRKWMALGFCAWLAGLSGGESCLRYYGQDQEAFRDVERALVDAGNTAFHNLALTLSLGAIAVVLVVSVMVLFLWLGSRGEMMFLHGVIRNRGEVAVPWRKWKSEAGSLFRFRLVFGGAGLLLILLFLLGLVLTARDSFQESHEPLSMMGICLLVLSAGGAILTCAALMIVTVFTNHFVVPILALRRGTCVGAWREMIGLLRRHRPEFFLYLLFQIVLGIAAVFAVLMAVIFSCLLGAVLLMIPVIGAALLLPVTLFLRNYQLLYLAQFGPEYDLLGSVPPGIPAP
jgi:hypothetical protein